MSKLCWRWKAWGNHECFKKCGVVSKLDEAYFHGSHIKSNLSDCYQPLCFIGRLTLTWPKTNKATLYCSPLASKYKGEWNKQLQFYVPKNFYTPCVYPVLEDDIMPQAMSQREIEWGHWKYKTWLRHRFLNWSTYFCYQLCSVVTNVVFMFWLWQELEFLFIIIISLQMTASVVLSGMVRIEVNMSVWN